MGLLGLGIPGLISGGVGLARSLFGGGNKGGQTQFGDPFIGRGDYIGAAQRGTARDFDYTQDPNDPEIGLRSRRARRLGSERYSGGVDEVGRAGLLGSGRAMRGLRDINRQTSRDIEDIQGDVFNKRRGEALGLYRDEESYLRQLELSRLRAMEGRESGRVSQIMGDEFARGREGDRNTRSDLLGLGNIFGFDIDDLIEYLNQRDNSTRDPADGRGA